MQPTQKEAQLRYLIYYLKVLHSANTLYLQGGESVFSGLNMFDIERKNIQNAQAWASEHMRDNKGTLEFCGLFAISGPDILRLRLTPGELIQWFDIARIAYL